MPLEIKEITVTATVTDNMGSADGDDSANVVSGINRDILIADCVEQVLEILREKNER